MQLSRGSTSRGDESRDIVIGTGLADILQVGLGDRIVITAAQAHTGELAQEMFRVSGIYYFNIPEMDKAMAFVRLGKAQGMVNLAGQAHEIALSLHDNSIGRHPKDQFWADYSTQRQRGGRLGRAHARTRDRADALPV